MPTGVKVTGTQLFGKLICMFKDHLPGRAIAHYVDRTTREHHFTYACPRCGFTWQDVKRGIRA